jgi:glutathione S-transferase
MTVTLYELAGAEADRRFSPYCWRIHLALLHKQIVFETVAWRFTDKAAIAFAGSDKVPVLKDGETAVHDSTRIAVYLEQHYADRPSLFGGPAAAAVSGFITDWCDSVLAPALFRLIGLDILGHLADVDRAYFRASREARVGARLEDFCADPAQRLPDFRASLAPLRRTLARQKFICGEAPAWADYVVFGAFQWARCISPLQLLKDDDVIYGWRAAMLDLWGGAAGKAKGYPV